jgi:hypothetical protein
LDSTIEKRLAFSIGKTKQELLGYLGAPSDIFLQQSGDGDVEWIYYRNFLTLFCIPKRQKIVTIASYPNSDAKGKIAQGIGLLSRGISQGMRKSEVQLTLRTPPQMFPLAWEYESISRSIPGKGRAIFGVMFSPTMNGLADPVDTATVDSIRYQLETDSSQIRRQVTGGRQNL